MLWLRGSQLLQVSGHDSELVSVNNSQDESESGSRPESHSSPLTTTGKKSKEGPSSEPDACSLEDRNNTYQALIAQQQPTDEDGYQSLTWHIPHKEYYNFMTPTLPPKPEAQKDLTVM